MKQTILSPEARVLLLSIPSLVDSDGVAAAIREPAFDWNRLVWLAEKEKAVRRLRDTLSRLPTDVVPAAARAHVGRLCHVSEFRMLRLERLLGEALDILAARGIETVLLKGAGLGVTVYGSFAARPMYDVDMLVRPQQAQAAWDALRSAGWVHNDEECPGGFYDSHYHLPPLDDPLRTGLALELHSAPTDGAVALTGDMIRHHAQSVEWGGRRVSVPAATHQVLHLAAHFAWTHGLGAAAWRTFHDLERLVSAGAIDWDAVMCEAEVVRARTCCYWTLRLARSLAGVAVPDEVLRRQRPPRPSRLLDLLERHYAAALFQFSPAACPSVRMTRLLWSVGMAPRWSGHGVSRPWHRGEVWAAPVQTPAGGSTVAQHLRNHATRGSGWRRYVAAVLSNREPVTPLDRPRRLVYD